MDMNNKSCIRGKGHGDSHCWEDNGTVQSPYEQNRSTLYICKKCKISFNHWYHVVPDIFEQMKQSGVSDKCNGT